MKLSSGLFALCVMILVVSESMFWHLPGTTNPECTDRCCGDPTGSFSDTSRSLWIGFEYLLTQRYVSWHLKIFMSSSPKWESLVVCIQTGYIWYPKGVSTGNFFWVQITTFFLSPIHDPLSVTLQCFPQADDPFLNFVFSYKSDPPGFSTGSAAEVQKLTCPNWLVPWFSSPTLDLIDCQSKTNTWPSSPI